MITKLAVRGALLALLGAAAIAPAPPVEAQVRLLAPASTRITLADQSNVTANGNTGAFNVAPYTEATVYINVSSWECSGSCSGGQVQIKIESSDDGGTTFYQHPGGNLLPVSQSGKVEPPGTFVGALGDTWRVRWTVTSSPTASFTVKAIFKTF